MKEEKASLSQTRHMRQPGIFPNFVPSISSESKLGGTRFKQKKQRGRTDEESSDGMAD